MSNLPEETLKSEIEQFLKKLVIPAWIFSICLSAVFISWIFFSWYRNHLAMEQLDRIQQIGKEIGVFSGSDNFPFPGNKSNNSGRKAENEGG